MSNNRKAFNFRNGVQVDNDNFVVNANGLVGIGTTNPEDYLLNVYGDTRVTGLVTTNNLYAGVGTVGLLTATNANITGVLTVSNLKVGNTSTVSNLIGYAYTTWINTGGVGLHTLSSVGIGTTEKSGLILDVLGNVNVTGVLTATNFSGIVTATDLAGTIDNARLPASISVNDVTATTFTGALTGNADTASNLTGNPNITVTSIGTTDVNASGIVTAITELNVGTGGTVLTALQSGNVGIGTEIPTSELQIRKPSDSLLEVVSDSGQARISIGQVTGVGNSTGLLRFGNVDKTLDLVNNDTGNLNFILHGGSAGVDTGRFDWLYGQNIVSPLMSLTYEGDFGIGETNPTNTLHVVGTSTVTSTAYFGGDVRAKKIYFTELVDGVVKTNANINSGISTFNKVYLTGGDNVLSINSDAPTGTNKFYIANSTDAYLGNQASMGSPVTADANYFASNLGADAAQLKVYGNSYVGSDLYVRGNLYATSQLASGLTGSPSITVTNVNASGIVTATNGFTSGIGSAVVISVVGNTLTFTVGTATTSLTLS
jgi:hypothetical protein